MRLAVLLLCVAACGNRETASPKPSPAKPAATASAKKIRSVEGITEYHLDNGLVALVFPDPTQSTVTVNITYLVGSRHEGYGETGMAHLLEHMIFKGTPTHRNVMKLLTERGAMSNGSTWFDRTNYYATLPASQDNLDFAVALNADCMRNATISAEDLASEFSVVRNEFEMDENNPQGILDERIVSTAFLWHNYGKSTIGSRADIEKVPAPALRAFYDKYYQPDNAVLVVSGKLDEAAALATIETHFGKIPRPQRKLTPTYTVEPVQDGEREVTLRRNGDVHTIGVAYHTVAATSPDFPAVEAALDVLVREPSGRLYKGLVENGLATSLWSQATPTHDPFLAQVGADVRDANAVPIVLALATSMIEGLGMSPVDAKELERWRAARLKDLELAMTDSESIAIELSEYAALGDWRTLFAYRSRVEAITAADVQRVAKLYFKRSNRTVGVFIPVQDAAADRAPHTERPDVAAYVKGIDGGTLKDQGEVFVATLDNIERRTTRAVLNGGIKAALLPKKTRGGKVQLALSLHWGDEQSLQNRATAAGLLGALMTRGTTKKTYQELQELEDKLRARISLSTTADGLVLHIETLRDHLPDAIELAMEILKSPSFPAKELELVRQETLAGLENQQQDPETIAWQTISQLTEQWPKSDPRYTQSIAEQIASVALLHRLRGRGPRRARGRRRLRSGSDHHADRAPPRRLAEQGAVHARPRQGVRRCRHDEVDRHQGQGDDRDRDRARRHDEGHRSGLPSLAPDVADPRRRHRVARVDAAARGRRPVLRRGHLRRRRRVRRGRQLHRLGDRGAAEPREGARLVARRDRQAAHRQGRGRRAEAREGDVAQGTGREPVERWLRTADARAAAVPRPHHRVRHRPAHEDRSGDGRRHRARREEVSRSQTPRRRRRRRSREAEAAVASPATATNVSATRPAHMPASL
jgi:zinc protease